MYDSLFDQLKAQPRLIVAEDYEVCQQVAEVDRVDFEDGQRTSEGNERAYWLSLRVLHRNRPGLAVLTTPSPEMIPALVERALTAAEASDGDPWFKFPLWRQRPESFVPKSSPLENWDRSQFSQLENPLGLHLAETCERWKIETTLFRRTERNLIRYSQTGARALWKISDPQGVLRVQETFFPNGNLEKSRWDKLGGTIRLLQTAEMLQEPIPGTVGFSPRAMASVLPAMADWFSARRVQSGKSPLHEEGLGKLSLGQGYSLFDDGRLAQNWMSAPYDLEGSPTQTTALIKNGQLTGFAFDAYSAVRANRLSTGNRTRRLGELEPRLGPQSFYLGASTKGLAQWWEELKDGTYIEGFRRLSVSQNVVQGEAYGWEVHEGAPTRSVVFPVSFSLYDLMKKTLGVADDLQFFEGWGSPSIFFPEIPLVK